MIHCFIDGDVAVGGPPASLAWHLSFPLADKTPGRTEGGCGKTVRAMAAILVRLAEEVEVQDEAWMVG